MFKQEIRLDTVEKVKDFSNLTGRFFSDMKLISKNEYYVVDAKSIMGIFSLDLMQPLTLEINKIDERDKELLTNLEVFYV